MLALTIQLDTRHDIVTMRLLGSASAANADTLDRAVRELAIRAPRRVVVDMRGLTFISSPALALIAHLQREVEAAGGSLIVSDAPPQIAQVVRTCRVGDLLPMAEDFARAG